MYRETSAAAFHEIEMNGLLSLRRFQVYKIIYFNQPINCRRMIEIASRDEVTNTGAFSGRLSELYELGVIYEHHRAPCPKTGHETIYWATTDQLPKKLGKRSKKKDKASIELIRRLFGLLEGLSHRTMANLNENDSDPRILTEKTYIFDTMNKAKELINEWEK